MVYSLLAIAESLGASASTSPPPQQLGESPPHRPGDTDKDLLTAQDVAHMTGLSVHTLASGASMAVPALSISSWVGASSTAAPRLSSGWHAPVSDIADRLAQALRDLIK
jgi:hypothetical protein